MANAKQDRSGVRTAQDLERKYKLSELVGVTKAIALQDGKINRTNAVLESFMKATLKGIDDLGAQLDGKVTTWYGNGEPTLEWETQEEKDMHCGDLYYDKDTGYAYIYELVDGVYGWTQIKDKDIAEALAIANSAKDTADGKRQVFTDTPYPPYENGDLWFKDSEIYICQISKDEKESFSESDFIIATKYTDDSYAQQVGDQLEVLKGTVLVIEESVNRFKAEIKDLDQETASSLELLKNELQVKIQDTVHEVVEVNNDLQSKYNLITKYFTFDVNGLTIGQQDSPYKVVIDNDRYSMMVNGEEVMWIANGEVHTPEIAIDKAIKFLGYLIDKDEEGRVNCEYIDLVTCVGLSVTYGGGTVSVGTALSKLTDITVTASFSDGSSAVVEDYTLSGSISRSGENIISVTYQEETTTFIVEAIEVALLEYGATTNCAVASWLASNTGVTSSRVYYSTDVKVVDGKVALVGQLYRTFYKKSSMDYSKNDYGVLRGKYVKAMDGSIYLIDSASSYTHNTYPDSLIDETIVYLSAQLVTVASK